jgi:hypothetical protein
MVREPPCLDARARDQHVQVRVAIPNASKLAARPRAMRARATVRIAPIVVAITRSSDSRIVPW